MPGSSPGHDKGRESSGCVDALALGLDPEVRVLWILGSSRVKPEDDTKMPEDDWDITLEQQAIEP
jgi:hypothetical protein